MNQRALDKEQYQPAFIEHIANIITHGVWIFPSILGMNELYKRSQDNAQVLSAIVYGITLISLFCISTSFHCVFYCQNQRTLKDILHRCDRGMIYIFIAGSYFPWLTIEKLPQEGWASHMRWHYFLGMMELTLGGILYVFGVLFFKCDGVIPFAHAIWHIFVSLAAYAHYYAILNYLYPLINMQTSE
ncbi:hypothetical protein D910_01831, partial [Dendroctonus ponderosae]